MIVVNVTSGGIQVNEVTGGSPTVNVTSGQTKVVTDLRGPAGLGVPAGGDARQVLAKLSAADYDSGWITLVAADVGLGNVADLAPADMPLSTAQQAAITAEAEARATADAQKVAKTGDVMTGVLTAPGLVVNGTGPGPAGYAISVPSPGAAFGSNFNYLNLNSGWGAINFNIWGAALGIMGGGFSALTLAGSIYVDKNRVIGISSGTAFGVGPDVAFSRLGAATFALGNGTAGNTSGSLSLKNLVASGGITAGAWTVATKPSPAAYPAGTLIYIADESGGPTLAWTDGAAWRRIRDNVIIS